MDSFDILLLVGTVMPILITVSLRLFQKFSKSGPYSNSRALKTLSLVFLIMLAIEGAAVLILLYNARDGLELEENVIKFLEYEMYKENMMFFVKWALGVSLAAFVASFSTLTKDNGETEEQPYKLIRILGMFVKKMMWVTAVVAGSYIFQMIFRIKSINPAFAAFMLVFLIVGFILVKWAKGPSRRNDDDDYYTDTCTCPNCGHTVQAYELRCPNCNHEM